LLPKNIALIKNTGGAVAPGNTKLFHHEKVLAFSSGKNFLISCKKFCNMKGVIDFHQALH
jgi:hypothetical protein